MRHPGGCPGVSQHCDHVGICRDFPLYNQESVLPQAGQDLGGSEGRRDCHGHGEVGVLAAECVFVKNTGIVGPTRGL